MKFIHTTLFVNDMDKSIAFYSELIGLEVVKSYEIANMKLAFLGKGETQIELAWNGEKVENAKQQNISVGFLCDDLADELEKMKANGFKILTEVIQPNPHVRFFFMEDPDGYKVQLMEHIN